jgi:dihydroorotate dehydrogenase
MLNTYPLVRPFLFSLDPEEAHDFSFAQLDRLERCGLLKTLIGKPIQKPVDLCGLHFRNPVGLAAGLDKDGKHIDALATLGFGFLEIGTVTPKPQPGNPKPRMFRLPNVQGLINRMGFNNDGVEACVARVKQSRFYQEGGVIGLNIGKNATTPIEHAVDDYVTCLKSVYSVASYITANISSPNTKNLRDLQGESLLRDLLTGLHQTRQALSDQYGVRKPIFLKIAPDLEAPDLKLIADLLLEFEIDAVIATNTTISRTGVEHLEHGQEAGGLSGSPVLMRSNQTIHHLFQVLHNRIPIIGVGGILSGENVKQKLDAGASLVQIYTGLIYKGPKLIADCVRAFP